MATSARGGWAQALDVRPWERQRLGLACLLWGTITWGQALAGTALQSLFLFGSGVDRLPLLFVLYAVLMVPTAALYTLALERLGIARLFYVLLAVLGGAALGLRALIAALGPGVELLFVAYLAYLVLLNLGMLQFWNYATRLFDTLEAKRLLPVIGAAGSLGLLASGFTAAVLAGPLGTPNLLLVWALILLAAAIVFRLCQARLGNGAAEPVASSTAAPSGLRALTSHRLLRCLMAAGFLLILLLYLLDYQIADVYTRTFRDSDELTTFLGRFTSVLSLLGLGLSLWLVPYWMTRLGVRQVAMVVPLATVISSAALAFAYRLPSAMVAATTRQAVVGAFDDPVQNLLLGLSGPRLQARARALLRGVVVPLAVASAGLLLLAVRGRLETTRLGLLMLAVAGAYLVVSGLLRREYVRALVARLREGRLNLDDLPPGAVRLTPGEVQALAAELDDADPRTRAFLVEALGRLGGRQAFEAVRRRLADSTPAVRTAALDAIAAIGDGRAIPWVLPLLEDEVPAVRAAAVRAVAALRAPAGVRALVPRLADPDGAVRVAAAHALAAAGPDGERSGAIAALEALARGGAPRERAAAATALSALGLPLPVGTRAALLEAREAEVRQAAVELERPSDAELSLLVRALGDPAERVQRAASDRLIAAGEAACLPLVAQFPELPEPGAALALACLVRIGSPAQQEEVDLLVAEELRRAAWDTGPRLGLASAGRPAAYELLYIALEHAYRRARQHALALATARSSERLAREIAGQLASADARRRADAHELLLNLLPAHCRKALGELSDAAAAAKPSDPDALLAEYLEHPDAWVRAGAYYAAGRLGRADLLPRVRMVHADTPLLAALVAETRAVLTGLAASCRPVPAGAASAADPAAGATAAAGGRIDDRQAIKGAYAVLDQLLCLHKVPLFRELTLEQLQALSSLLEEREYLAGEQIVQEGDEGHELFVILAGGVRIVRGSGRQTVVLGELGPQDYFGEMALLAERPRAATVVAASNCRLGVLAKEHFLAVLSQQPEISLAVIQVLSNRLAEANDRLLSGR